MGLRSTSRRAALPALAVVAAGLLALGCGDSGGLLLGEPALALVTQGLPLARANQSYAYTLQAAGGRPPYSWAIVSGSLPGGLALVPATGQVGGVAKTAGEVGSFRLRVIDQDTRFVDVDRVLAVEKEMVITTPSRLGDGRVGFSYFEPLQSSGGFPPVTWSVASALPPGFVLNRLTGHLVGTPTKDGLFTFALTATDTLSVAGQASVTKTFELNITR